MEYQDDVALWVELSGSELCHDAICDLSRFDPQIQKGLIVVLERCIAGTAGECGQGHGGSIDHFYLRTSLLQRLMYDVDLHSLYMFDLLLKRLI